MGDGDGVGMGGGTGVNSLDVKPNPKRLTRKRALEEWKEVAATSGTPGLINSFKVHERVVESPDAKSKSKSQSKTKLSVYKEHRDEILAEIPEAP